MCQKSTCFLRYSLLGPLNLHRKNHFSNIGGVKTYQDPPCSNIGGVLTPWTPPCDAPANINVEKWFKWYLYDTALLNTSKTFKISHFQSFIELFEKLNY